MANVRFRKMRLLINPASGDRTVCRPYTERKPREPHASSPRPALFGRRCGGNATMATSPSRPVDSRAIDVIGADVNYTAAARFGMTV